MSQVCPYCKKQNIVTINSQSTLSYRGKTIISPLRTKKCLNCQKIFRKEEELVSSLKIALELIETDLNDLDKKMILLNKKLQQVYILIGFIFFLILIIGLFLV